MRAKEKAEERTQEFLAVLVSVVNLLAVVTMMVVPARFTEGRQVNFCFIVPGVFPCSTMLTPNIVATEAQQLPLSRTQASVACHEMLSHSTMRHGSLHPSNANERPNRFARRGTVPTPAKCICLTAVRATIVLRFPSSKN